MTACETQVLSSKQDINHCNVLVTGIPRSGTTFFCSLLNSCDNTLALVEPFDTERFVQSQKQGRLISHVDDELNFARIAALDSGLAYTKKPDNCNTVTELVGFDNTFSSTGSIQSDQRPEHFVYGHCSIDKELDDDFVLAIKHPNIFMATLGTLCKKYRVVALVRNPVDVIMSWSSLSSPLAQGHAPAAEALDAELARDLKSISSTLERQVYLLGWYFQRLQYFHGYISVIKHENLVENPQHVLATLGFAPTISLSIRKSRTYSINSAREQITEALLSGRPEHRHFYDLSKSSRSAK